jgi:hypothetical protein
MCRYVGCAHWSFGVALTGRIVLQSKCTAIDKNPEAESRRTLEQFAGNACNSAVARLPLTPAVAGASGPTGFKSCPAADAGPSSPAGASPPWQPTNGSRQAGSGDPADDARNMPAVPSAAGRRGRRVKSPTQRQGTEPASSRCVIGRGIAGATPRKRARPKQVAIGETACVQPCPATMAYALGGANPYIS